MERGNQTDNCVIVVDAFGAANPNVFFAGRMV